jgi:hypothetical protein
MLRKWPFPNKLSEMFAWATGLWIRRVLVRAQEGQLEAPFQLGLEWRFPYLRRCVSYCVSCFAGDEPCFT